MRIRYVGSAPISLMSIGLELSPDDVAEIRDDLAQGLLTRDDFVAAPEPEKAAPKSRRASVPTPVDAADAEQAPAEAAPDTVAE